MPGYYDAQVYSYPARRWRKKRRQYLLNDSYATNSKECDQTNGESMGALSQENSNASGTTGLVNNSGSNIVQNGNCVNMNNSNANSALNDTFEDSKDSWMRYEDDGSDIPDAGELDDPESDYDDYEEYSSRKRKSKRKDLKKKRSDYSEGDKPFLCELCGARYKTRPGLSYHYSHSHQDNGNIGLLAGNGISEEEVIFNSVRNSSQSGNNLNASSNHSSHSNSINSQRSQSPLNSSPSNHLLNNSSKSSDDKDKKGKTKF